MPAKTISTLDDLDVPPWFSTAAEDLKSTRPRWAMRLPTITLRDGESLPTESHPWVLGAMAYMEAEAVRHDLLDLLKRHADANSLDTWMAAVLTTWTDAGSPESNSWALTAAGYLGGDITVRGLQTAVRRWTKEKQRALAVRGVDALGRIGTKAALQEIATLAAETRSSTAVDEAQQLIEKKARTEGASRDEIEDRHVSDCGLNTRGERTFSYGPRTFRAVLGRDLTLVLYDQDNRKRVSLPPPGVADDPILANASRASWAEMKPTFKRVVKAQLKRFEQAMITGRSWSLTEFQGTILKNPIVSRIAQLLLWQSVEDSPRCLRLTEDLTLADANDESAFLAESERIRVAHPLRLSPGDLTAWSVLFTDYRIVQPFQQLTRPAYQCELTMIDMTSLAAPEHAAIKAGVLYGVLDNDGWRLGRPEESRFSWSWKSFVADGVTAVITYSGLTVGAIAQSPDQQIIHCTFHPGIMTPEQKTLPGRPMNLGLVPAVPFSETMRRLIRITSLES